MMRIRNTVTLVVVSDRLLRISLAGVFTDSSCMYLVDVFTDSSVYL
ncbi:MAG: hypothetical protein LUD00_01705 [Prevotellaceae bacterium]|nr:hypothetical protein [Prevotellaceae bacterium]